MRKEKWKLNIRRLDVERMLILCASALVVALALRQEEPASAPSLEPLENRHVLHSSDAHYLGDIQEQVFSLRLPEKSVSALLDWMRSRQNA